MTKEHREEAYLEIKEYYESLFKNGINSLYNPALEKALIMAMSALKNPIAIPVNWKEIPEDFNYVAIDDNGLIHYYENHPTLCVDKYLYWMRFQGGKAAVATGYCRVYKRPEQ